MNASVLELQVAFDRWPISTFVEAKQVSKAKVQNRKRIQLFWEPNSRWILKFLALEELDCQF